VHAQRGDPEKSGRPANAELVHLSQRLQICDLCCAAHLMAQSKCTVCDILQALGLPETCTLSKVTLRSLADGQLLSPPGETGAVCAPNSLTTAPEFRLREEFRSTQGFNRSTTMVSEVNID
jgi:hypothetical protein